jgi:hypothetical protein
VGLGRPLQLRQLSAVVGFYPPTAEVKRCLRLASGSVALVQAPSGNSADTVDWKVWATYEAEPGSLVQRALSRTLVARVV